jgi:uncharacterized lipoprotein YmbA
MMRSRTLLITLLTATALAGCGASPQARFYTMSPGAALGQADSKAPFSVAIGPVSVPDMIDRPQIVTRDGANQVMINEFARWAGPLKSEIPRVIAGNLTRLLNGAPVYTYPQSASVKADYKVLLDVQQFDSELGDAATLEVLWSVQPTKGGEPKTGRAVVREPTGADKGADKGYDALVAAHSRALMAVSRDIAAAIQTPPTPQ